MAITVKYAPSAALVGQAAFEGGFGQASARAQAQADATRAREAQAMMEYDLRRQQGRDKLAYNRDQAALARQHQAMMDQQNYEQALAQQAQEFDMRDQLESARVRRSIEAGEAEYTAKQRRTLASIDESIAAVESNEGYQYTPEEQQYALMQLRSKKLGIKPMPKRTPEPKAPTMSEDGMWVRNSRGDWEPNKVYMDGMKERIKYEMELRRIQTVDEDGNPKPAYNDDKIAALVNGRFSYLDRSKASPSYTGDAEFSSMEGVPVGATDDEQGNGSTDAASSGEPISDGFGGSAKSDASSMYMDSPSLADVEILNIPKFGASENPDFDNRIGGEEYELASEALENSPRKDVYTLQEAQRFPRKYLQKRFGKVVDQFPEDYTYVFFQNIDKDKRKAVENEFRGILSDIGTSIVYREKGKGRC